MAVVRRARKYLLTDVDGTVGRVKAQCPCSVTFREKERQAARLAREIDNTATAVELENGDEEEAFSAVQRPQTIQRQDSESSKYVTPARRQSSGSNASSTSKPQQSNSGKSFVHTLFLCVILYIATQRG